MSFNYCSSNPTYYTGCVAGVCQTYSGYKVEAGLADEPCTINIGTYHACCRGDGNTSAAMYAMTGYHCPVGECAILYGNWDKNCQGQNAGDYNPYVANPINSKCG